MDNKTRIAVIVSLLIGYGLFFGWAVAVHGVSFREQYPLLIEEFESNLGNVKDYRPKYMMPIYPEPRIPVSFDTFMGEVELYENPTVFRFVDRVDDSRSIWRNRYFVYSESMEVYFEYRLKIDVESYGIWNITFKVV